MNGPRAHSSSGTARLMAGALGYQVGWQQPVYVPNPAAGAQWSFTVDGRYYTRVLAVRFTFTTDAVVGNRSPQLVLTDTNGFVITKVPAGSGIAASSSVSANLSLIAPQPALGGGGDLFGYLPDLLLPPGWTWGTSVGTIDPGDQFSGIVLLVQQFPNDAASFTVSE